MAEEQKAIEPTTAKQRLILKLVAADKMVSGVYKDGENSFQHYVFQSEAAIKDAVKPALNSNGLTVVPKYTILGQRDVQTKKGIQHVVDVMGEFTISDGIESITGSMVASGADTLEKATAKACTTAEKYFYKQLFHITDKEQDPDSENAADNQQTQFPPADSAMINALKALAADTAQKMGADYKQFCKNVFVAAQVDVRKGWKLDTEEYKRVDTTIAQMTKR
ncbi:ERF family protein [Lacticaseibacillus sharpeae]|uniref:Uncharacterized protein n=2 Tax=Lacticaseibacillus sharpeae TaxID=1626 RepID=A0A0R1ZSV1_9LACO|nr:ERF family protein [Lacticaseibacillus sharpeae]KRM54790.1 hypothetical protein FC18_GL002206 [Lacticaseibacillus sharpeae JCM 1186 = DSM 20505]